MQRLAQIRTAIQAKILRQYPELNADAIAPYCRLMARRALALAATNADAIEADPELKRENDLMRVTLAEEVDALRDVLPEAIERLEAYAGANDCDAEPLAHQVLESFINGGLGTPPLSLKAIRARVDTATYLISRWGSRDKELPAYTYWQHRLMVWLLALECDAPGLLSPYHPEHPEGKAEMCENLFPVEIAALKRVIEVTVRRIYRRRVTEAQLLDHSDTILDEIEHDFVGDRPEPPADWQAG